MTDTQIQSLTELVVAETRQFEQMLELLDEEQRALIGGNIADIEKFASGKLELLEQIDHSARLRAEALRAFGIDSRTALYRWLSDRLELLSIWQHLELVSEKARAANDLNGKLISDRLLNVNQALSALMSSEGSTLSYGRDGGKQSIVGGGRNLGAA
ncbi:MULTISPECIES: flagella synthesis protein FlgN [Microvirgula]|uniref:Flagellar protein FlgN n=1 Tax=Microvirgula aerodenitrificans TaxID=57480 RepID=A0A2S0P7D7_9NEIS|nr:MULTISPECIES: flagellar protein FlgN [Microvirgula]AVY93252.1 flagellar protein FlgN [Microvirgula aerodenitrificans]RAS19753.1 flagella synthesis protein FlgN [Microvirgula sp. AG722]